MSLTTLDTISPADVLPLDESGTLTEAKALILIEDVVSRAFGLVPELEALSAQGDGHKFKAAKGIIRGAVLRAHSAGSGAIVQQSVSAGAYSESQTIDNKQTTRAVFTQSELKELRGLVNTERKAFKGKAFSVEMW